MPPPVQPTGLNWVSVGTTRPPGLELHSKALALALLKKATEYTVQGEGGRKEVRTRLLDKPEVSFTEVEWKDGVGHAGMLWKGERWHV